MATPGTLDFTTPNALSLTGGTVDYSNPDWYNQYMQNVAGVGNNLAAGPTTPGSIAYNTNNWYSQPLTGDWNANLQAGSTAAAGANAPGGYLQQAGTYDPAKMQGFMNPYTQDAAQSTINLSNKNLFESILPNVNSSFTGAGQFGSTRNADFTNRAIRDQQRTLTDSIGALNYGAVKDANQTYANWADRGLTAGNQNIQNLTGTGKGFLDWQNAGFGAGYQDYLKQLEYPTQAMGALSTMTGALKGTVQPSQTMTPGAMTPAQKAMMIAQLANTATSGSTLSDLSALWDSIFS